MNLKDFERKLNELQRNAERLHGTHQVPLTDLFNDEFLLQQSDFATLSALFEATGFKLDTQEDFDQVPEAAWDEFVRRKTRFNSWQEMYSAATKEWMTREMGF